MASSSAVERDQLKFFRSLPPAPNVDIKQIKGNIPDDQKQLSVNALAYFVSKGISWGASVGQRMKMLETNVWKREGSSLEAQNIFEIHVTEDMCNVFGVLHGACAAYLMDPATSSALVTLGIATGIDGSGVSQSMNIIWHQPARLGTKLKLICTSITIQGRVRSARCEIWDAEKGVLCITGIHSTINPNAKLKTSGKL